jgi:hypothetical protein
LQAWSVQPCVRPVCAVHMTAGHNALRGSGPGQNPAFDDAMAHVGCPDRRIDRLCITCCSPSQPCMGQLLSSLIFDLFHLLVRPRWRPSAHPDLTSIGRPRGVTVKGGRRPSRKRLALDGHEHGGRLGWSVELSLLQCGQTTTIRGARHRARRSRHNLVFGRSARIGTMMQSWASAAKLRGGGPILHSGLGSHGWRSGHRHLGSSSADPCMGRQGGCSVVLSSRAVAHDAGRKTTPCGTSPVVTRRQRAMSSLRASATIIVLRVLPRPSAVRA